MTVTGQVDQGASANKGMRLLYGTITCKDLWLSLGETAHTQQKLFEFGNDLSVPVRVAHYPAYCSKFNPIERRLFSHVTKAFASSQLTQTTGSRPL